MTAFQVSDRYVDELAAAFPVVATHLGVAGRHDEWGDGFGIGGHEKAVDLSRRYRKLFEPYLNDPDPLQRRAAKIAVGKIDEQLEADEAGDHFRNLRHLGSKFGEIRSVFDVMPTDTAGDWSNMVTRLATIERPLQDYMGLLDTGRANGTTVARRQTESVIRQARALAGDGSAFATLVDKAGDHLSPELEAAVDHARSQAARFADWLESTYLPDAVESDAAGEEVYRRASDRLVGMTLDLDETYQWGWEEFHRIRDEMLRVGEMILPGAGVLEVKDHLESDIENSVPRDGLTEFVGPILEAAAADLSGTHFAVPDEIRPLTVNLAPPGRPLGAYYMRPSEDLKRPGGVYYSVGDQQMIPTYQHVSTAYHEGFPGHHLQIATAMYQKDSLSRTQRVDTFYPGYAEGWAMYAEVLMGELGYLEDPRHYFGMLAKQMYRASRVVVDIGLHLEKSIHTSSPLFAGTPWSFEKAVEFIRVYGFRTDEQAEAEILRYLGWPGQAIAYKVGEKEILSIRQDSKQRLGDRFDLKRFHAVVLEGGPMRIDMLREAVADEL